MNISQLIEAQPKSVVRQFRILLFPDTNSWQYYRIVLGRLVFWMVLFLIFSYAFVIGKSYFDKVAAVIENDHCRKAWLDLYWHSKKAQQQRMDSVWYKN